MSQLLDTKEFTDKYRVEKCNGIRQFNKCEYCGYETKEGDGIGIVYYHRYKKVLCDRCVDNKDGLTVWSDKRAASIGLPHYPWKPWEVDE